MADARSEIEHGIQEVLGFWFSEHSARHWFAPTPAFDQEIRTRFAETFAQAASGELRSWEQSPEGCVALSVLLDQMPRNMFRGTPGAFATDENARAIAERAVNRGFDRGVPPGYKNFPVHALHAQREAWRSAAHWRCSSPQA